MNTNSSNGRKTLPGVGGSALDRTPSDYVKKRIRELAPEYGWEPEAVEQIVVGDGMKMTPFGAALRAIGELYASAVESGNADLQKRAEDAARALLGPNFSAEQDDESEDEVDG